MANTQSGTKNHDIDSDLLPYRSLFASLVKQSVRDARLHPEKSSEGAASDAYYQEVTDIIASMLKYEALTKIVLPQMLRTLEAAAILRKKKVPS